MPFEIQELKKPTIFNKIIRSIPKENALIEINNLLAKSKDILNVQPDDIIFIVNKYKINLVKKFKNELLNIYGKYLSYCLKDKHLSDEELNSLSHLKRLLLLNDNDVNKVYNDIVTKVYSESIDEVLSDGRYTDEEKDYITKLKNNIKLPDDIADKIYAQKAKDYYTNVLNKSIEDARLSPECKIRLKPATDSGVNLPPVPEEGCHPFRNKPATF